MEGADWEDVETAVIVQYACARRWRHAPRVTSHRRLPEAGPSAHARAGAAPRSKMAAVAGGPEGSCRRNAAGAVFGREAEGCLSGVEGLRSLLGMSGRRVCGGVPGRSERALSVSVRCGCRVGEAGGLDFTCQPTGSTPGSGFVRHPS